MSDLQEFLLHGPLKLQQLQLAHSSTVIVYMKTDARDKEMHIKELARKLRPEFSRLYLSDDVKECLKLLNRHTNDEALPPIDLVIMDFDTQSMKMLDMLNKRSVNPLTKHLPLISTIVLLPLEYEGSGGPMMGEMAGMHTSGATMATNSTLANDYDPKQMIANVGGCNVMLSHNVSTKQMLYSALDTLWRRKLIESSYKDVLIVKSVSAKYPFYPIFSQTRGAGGDGRALRGRDAPCVAGLAARPGGRRGNHARVCRPRGRRGR